LIRDHRLHLRFTFDINQYRPETIEDLAQGFLSALRSLITHCLSAEAGGYTPSDFPLAQLGQSELEEAFQEFDFQERGSV